MKKNNKNKILKYCLVTVIAIIIIITAIFVIKNISEQNSQKKTYTLAVNLLEQQKYDDAIKSFKQIENYKDTKEQIKKAYYLYAKSEIEQSSYNKALYLLEKCKDYEDTNDLIIDTKYNYAISIIQSDYEKAKSLFIELDDYKDSKKYLNKVNIIENMLGGYSVKNALYNIKIIVSSSQCRYYYIEDMKVKQINLTFTMIDDDNFKCGNTNFTRNTYFKTSFVADKIDTNFSLGMPYTNVAFLKSDTKIPYTPKINMTKKQVEESIWGKPYKVNKSTYSWGTTEQWVYSNNKYIYFKNEIVTSISE